MTFEEIDSKEVARLTGNLAVGMTVIPVYLKDLKKIPVGHTGRIVAIKDQVATVKWSDKTVTEIHVFDLIEKEAK